MPHIGKALPPDVTCLCILPYHSFLTGEKSVLTVIRIEHRLYHCPRNICEQQHVMGCDTFLNLYIGSDNASAPQLCPKHFHDLYREPNPTFVLKPNVE